MTARVRPGRRFARLLGGTINPNSLEERDADFCRALLRGGTLLADRYFRAEVEGLENVPDRPFLAVGNHSGGTDGYDAGIFLVALWRARGPELPLYALAHDAVFWLPRPLVRALQRIGVVRASPENLARIFARGASALVYPGGDLDALRPFRRRNQVVFDGRSGFVRAALRAGVPIVPVVTHGAHDSLVVLTDGRRLARRLRLHRLFRVDVLPLALGLPWGLFPAYLFYLPLPLKVRVRVLPPVELGLPPAAADDPRAVAAGFALVVSRMQAALAGMATGGRRRQNSHRYGAAADRSRDG